MVALHSLKKHHRICDTTSVKLRLSLVHYILLAIPDTLFFQPAFPFSDYCLKRRKAQSAKS